MFTLVIRKYMLGLLALWLYSASALALDCAEDLDGSGAIDQPNEFAQCQTTPQGDYCSVSSAACVSNETCPLDPNLACTNGQCTQTGLCKPIVDPDTNTIRYQCSQNGITYSALSSCQSACTRSAQCTVQPPSCPLGDQYACMEVNTGEFRCSPNECFDSSATPPETTEIDTSMPDNSGPRDATGACTGNITFFSGRRMACKKSGLKSNWTNCCNLADRDTITDTVGSDVESLVIQQGIGVMFDFAATAYTTFTNLSGGALGTLEQAQVSAQYAYNSVLTPATFYTAAIVVAVQWLMTPQCSQNDMETSALKKSGYCHYVGTYCSERWNILGGSICVQKKNAYCCFNSKLARLINEQGREQIDMGGWGTTSAPNCKGFTPEQFQSLDFGAMDLSEYYGYLEQKAADVINQGIPQQNMNDAVQNFYNNLQ